MSLLSQIKVGTDHKPPRLVIYGVHGIGKSSIASGAPNPIMIDVEGGADEIGVPRFPVAVGFLDIQDQIIALIQEDHDYQTLVIDSADWAEKLIWAKTAERMGVRDVSEVPYGRGYMEALVDWRFLLQGLDTLRDQRGMSIIMLAHSEVKRFDDPSSDGYDRHQIALHKGASALVQEWADAVLFYGWQVLVKQSDAGFNRKVAKGRGNGARLLHTEERPSALAKNRYGMPERIDMPDAPAECWNALATHLPYFAS